MPLEGPTANPGTPSQLPENVQILVSHAQELAKAEAQRTHDADVRAGGLALLANGLLAVGATAGSRIGQFSGADLVEKLLPWVYAISLFLLLGAGISAALSLRITAAPHFRPSVVAGFRGTTWQLSEPLSVQSRLLDGWIASLTSSTVTYDAKTQRLRVGYTLFAAGLFALVLVAITLSFGA